MKKKAALPALALVLILAFTACSGAAPGEAAAAAPAEGAAPASESGSITLRYMSGASGRLMQAEQKVIDNFTAANPNISVEVTSVTGTAEFITAIKAKFAAGEAPDAYIFQGGNRVKEFAKAGLLYDLTDEAFMDRIKEEDKAFNSYAGRSYGVPQDYQVTGLFVNTGKLAEYPDVAIPNCFPELLAANQQLRDAGLDFPQIIGGKDVNNVSQVDFQYLATVVLPTIPDYYEQMLAGERHFNDPFIRDMFDKFGQMKEYMSPDALGVDNDEAIKRFIRGEGVFWIAHGNTVTRIRELAPDFEFTIVPSVLQDKPEDRVINAGLTNAVSIVKDTKYLPETIAFVDHYFTEESMGILVTEGGIISAINGFNLMPDRSLDTMSEWLNKTGDDNKKIGHADLVWVPGIKDTMKEVTQKWFMGEPLDSVLDEWEAQHQRLLEADPSFAENFGKE